MGKSGNGVRVAAGAWRSASGRSCAYRGSTHTRVRARTPIHQQCADGASLPVERLVGRLAWARQALRRHTPRFPPGDPRGGEARHQAGRPQAGRLLLGGLLGKLIGPVVGKDVARPLATIVSDVGMKLPGFELSEADQHEAASRVVARTVEETVRRVEALPSYALDNEALLESHAFEAAAGSFPPGAHPPRAPRGARRRGDVGAVPPRGR